MDMKAILAARAARKKGKKKKAVVALAGVRSVARPEQLQESTQPTMALVTGQELLNSASDLALFQFDNVENDPILNKMQAQRKEGAAGPRGPAVGDTEGIGKAPANPAKEVAAKSHIMFSPLNALEKDQPTQDSSGKGPARPTTVPTSQANRPSAAAQEAQSSNISSSPTARNRQNDEPTHASGSIHVHHGGEQENDMPPNGLVAASGGESGDTQETMHSMELQKLVRGNSGRRQLKQGDTIPNPLAELKASPPPQCSNSEIQQRVAESSHHTQSSTPAIVAVGVLLQQAQSTEEGEVEISLTLPATCGRMTSIDGTNTRRMGDRVGRCDSSVDKDEQHGEGKTVTCVTNDLSSAQENSAEPQFERSWGAYVEEDETSSEQAADPEVTRQYRFDFHDDDDGEGDDSDGSSIPTLLNHGERKTDRHKEEELLRKVENDIHEAEQREMVETTSQVSQAEKSSRSEAQSEVHLDRCSTKENGQCMVEVQLDVGPNQCEQSNAGSLLQHEPPEQSQIDPQQGQSKKRSASAEPENFMPSEKKRQRQEKETVNLGSEEAPICLDSDEDDEVLIEERRKNKPHLVKATKVLPKYLMDIGVVSPDARTVKPFLTSYILETQVICPFLLNRCPNQSRKMDFRVKLLDISSDPHSYVLTVKGSKLMVEAFRTHLNGWLQRQFMHQHIQDLLADRGRSEVDVMIPRRAFLEAWNKGCIQEVKKRGTTTSLGLWVGFSGRHRGAVSKLFEPILGSEAIESPGLAVAVLCLEGHEYSSTAGWEQVKKKYERLDATKITITINVGAFTNLNGLDCDKVDGEIRRLEDGSLPPPEIEVGPATDVSSLKGSITRRSNSSSWRDSNIAKKSKHWRSSSSSAEDSPVVNEARSCKQNQRWHTNQFIKQPSQASASRRPVQQQQQDHFPGSMKRTLVASPCKPILRRRTINNRRQQNQRTHFTNMHCVRTYPDPKIARNVKLSESESWCTAKVPPENSEEQQTSEVTSLIAASNALEESSLHQFISCVQTIRTDQSLNGKNFFDDAVVKTKGKDKERIRKVAKIYKSAKSAIHIAQTLKCWQRFRVQVVKIQNFSLIQEGMQHRGLIKGSVSCISNDKEKVLKMLPKKMVVAQEVNYGSGNATHPECSLSHNRAYQRCLRIQLQSVLERTEHAPLLEMSLEMSLEEINRQCMIVGEPVTMTKELCVGSTGSKYMKRGVNIQLRVVKLSMMESGCTELENVICWTQRFNHEDGPGGPKLNAQICGKERYSLLHAAIRFGRPDLVQKLLQLKANPTAKSGAGTPLLYALNMLDYAREKRDNISLQRRDLADNDHFDCRLSHAKETRQEQTDDRIASLETISKNLAEHSKVHCAFASDSHSDFRAIFDEQNAAHLFVDGSIKEMRRTADSMPSKPRNDRIQNMTPKQPAHLSPVWDLEGKDSSESGALLSDVFLFLEAASPDNSTDGEWVEMLAATKFFCKRCGSEDIALFRRSRSIATAKDLVEWGASEDDDFGAEVEVTSPEQLDGKAEGAYLRLTTIGEEVLSAHKVNLQQA